jgi:putative peptidoglycan lipid II flippase
MVQGILNLGIKVSNTLKILWKGWSEGSINRRILGAALTIGILTFGVHLVAMVKELVVAASFGTGDVLDAFLIAMVIPTFVINVIAVPLHSALIPTYIQVRDQEGIEEAQTILSSMMVYCIGMLLIVTVILTLLGPSLFPILASGFDSEKIHLTEMIFYCLIPIILIQGVVTIWSAVLNARRRFILAAIAPAIVPFVIIIALISGKSSWGIYTLAGGTIIGFIGEAVVIGFGLKRQGLRLKPQFIIKNPYLRVVIKQYALIIAGAFLMSSTNLIDQGMAAMLRPGSVAVLNYGSRLVNLGIGLIATSLGVAVFPYFSSQAAHKDWSGLLQTAHFYLRWVFIVMIPISLFVFTFSETIIRLIFERGAFSPEDTRLVSQVQALFGLQIPLHIGGILLVRVLSSLQKNHILIWASGFNLFIKIILNYFFVMWIGVAGIALSTSFMYLGSLLFVYYFVRVFLNKFRERDHNNRESE